MTNHLTFVILLLTIVTGSSAGWAQPDPSLNVKESGREIHFGFSLPANISRIKWTIYSGRNDTITRLSDRSPHAPGDYSYLPGDPGREIWFPVIDVALDDSFTAVATFTSGQAGDSVCFNGNFWQDCAALQPELRYPTHQEHWENQLLVISETAVLSGFFLEKVMPVVENADTTELTLLPLAAGWYGRVQLWGQTEDEAWRKLGEERVERDPNTEQETDFPPVTSLTKEVVTESLRTTIHYLLNSQNRNPLSPTYGGLYLFYDMDADTYRRSDWIWSYGPSLEVLVDAARIPEVASAFGYENLMESARLLAESSLRFQVTDEDHPAYGLVLCRYDPRLDSPQGAEGYYSPADSYFLAGWGWMPYYRASGDPRFLDASVRMTEEIGRILTYDDIVEQDYLMKAKRWKNWTMDESGFGMKGAEEVYATTQNQRHQVIGRKYIEGLLEHLEREDGLWDRTWHRNEADRADNGWPVGGERGTPVLIETAHSTRGLGWAMIGLLSSHGLLPENDIYLNKAIRLSDHLVESQAADGHWNFQFRGGEYEDEVTAKGTTLWTLLFYQLYHYTRDPRHLEVARKGLTWCINQRYRGADAQAYGGIYDVNRESGVVYRRWNQMVCSYTMGWFGLALLEELKVREQP